MKKLLLLAMACVPLFGFTINFNFVDTDEDGWCDEYWYEDYWCDNDWIYYPHGYYCVHYVSWYPWWWDWYWVNCRWCHNFYWDFFYSGFYVVWYDNGGWWYRPRYGYYVRYELPYSYAQIRYQAGLNGINLPANPPTQINLAYQENQIRTLSEKHDPQLFARVQAEDKSGNLERMRQSYDSKISHEIVTKNEKYGIDNNNTSSTTRSKKSAYATPQDHEKNNQDNLIKGDQPNQNQGNFTNERRISTNKNISNPGPSTKSNVPDQEKFTGDHAEKNSSRDYSNPTSNTRNDKKQSNSSKTER